MEKPHPSIELIRDLFLYDYETGKLYWNKRRCGTIFGKEAGTDHKGYKRVKVNGKLILAHRLIWAIVYGYWPSEQVDHINMIRDDNRIGNLREAGHSENMINRFYPVGASKVTGVSKHKSGWQAAISINGKNIYLGLFQTIEQAHAVRLQAEKALHGQYSPRG